MCDIREKPPLICTLYCSEAGVYVITHACMVAPMDAERAYGPLKRLGDVDTNHAGRVLGRRIEAQLDARSFAVVGPEDAPRIWPHCRAALAPSDSASSGGRGA